MGVDGTGGYVHIQTVELGGSGGGGGTGGSGGGGPHQADGWHDAPSGLKTEVFGYSADIITSVGGQEHWNALHEQLKQNNVKCDEQRTVAIFECSDPLGNSRTVWAEYGTKLNEPRVENRQEVSYQNGAIHIYEKHQHEFEKRGVGKNIMHVVQSIVTSGTLVSSNKNRGEEIYRWNEKEWLVAIGQNGYIRSARPYRKSDK